MADSNNPFTEYKPRSGTLGAPTSYNKNGEDYKTSGLMYPSDLMADQNNQYGGNYVIFYINVHEDSVLAKNNAGAYVDAAKVTPREQGSLKGTNFSSATLAAAGVGAAAVATNATGAAQRVAGAGGVDLTSKGATVLNTVGGAIAGGAIIANIGGPKAEMKRQKRAIALYVPNETTAKYGVQWDADGMAGTQAILEGLSGNLVAGLDYASGLAVSTPGVGAALGKTSGTAANPKKEQLFKEVDFRSFSFSYMFFPKSEQEARHVLAIIKEFKLHMHPEYRPNSNQFLFIYPSEFDIFYYQNGKENMNLHRHTSCVLTDMLVQYSPQGTFATFDNGMPTQINVQMTFRELAILTKQQIADGY